MWIPLPGCNVVQTTQGGSRGFSNVSRRVNGSRYDPNAMADVCCKSPVTSLRASGATRGEYLKLSTGSGQKNAEDSGNRCRALSAAKEEIMFIGPIARRSRLCPGIGFDSVFRYFVVGFPNAKKLLFRNTLITLEKQYLNHSSSPSQSGTNVLQLWTKSRILTPKWSPTPMQNGRIRRCAGCGAFVFCERQRGGYGIGHP